MTQLVRRGVSLVLLLRRLPYVRSFLRLLWRLWRDARVPVVAKLVLVLAVGYCLWPFDLIPAMLLPVIGVMDDIALLFFAMSLFFEWCPEEVIAEHLATLDDEFQRHFWQWRGSTRSGGR